MIFRKVDTMIRLILVVLYLFLFLVLSTPVLVAEWLIGKRNPARKDKSSKAIISWSFRCVIFLAGTKVIVKGRENLPTDNAALFVGNHRSYFDIILTYPLFPRVTGYVAKKEMTRYPLLVNWMRNIRCLFLDRDNIKEGLKTILTGVEEVRNGTSLCIFPEGTRNKVNDTFLPFHEGSFKIAEKGGVPVVPMVIVNAADVFEDHLPWIRKTTVVIEFLPPLDLKAMDKSVKKNLGTHVSGLISERYFQLKKEHFGG